MTSCFVRIVSNHNIIFQTRIVLFGTGLTYGMIEMGGASTQIANFENNGDVMVSYTAAEAIAQSLEQLVEFLLCFCKFL